MSWHVLSIDFPCPKPCNLKKQWIQRSPEPFFLSISLKNLKTIQRIMLSIALQNLVSKSVEDHSFCHRYLPSCCDVALIIPSAKRPSTSKIFEVIVQETLKLVKGCRPCNWGCLVQKLTGAKQGMGLAGMMVNGDYRYLQIIPQRQLSIIDTYRSCPHSLCLAPVRKSVGNYPLAKGRSFRRPEVVPLED